MKFLHCFLFIFLVISITGYAQTENSNLKKSESTDTQFSVNTYDLYDYMAINQIMMYFSNNGSGSYNKTTDAAGFYWPGGTSARSTSIFKDGLVWAGKVNGEIRAGGNPYRNGLQPGKIINGLPDNPALARYRIYKIRKGWENIPYDEFKERLNKDLNGWPIHDGAPWKDVNMDGIYSPGLDEPVFIGDEVNWMVMNDMDTSMTKFVYGTAPMGLEVQAAVYGYSKTGTLGNVVFKHYKIINKGSNLIDSMFIGYWSDPDLGYSNDDYVGCDTLLDLAYCYNGNSSDPQYGNPPPSVGYDLLQGPIIPYDPSKYPVINSLHLPDSAYYNDRWIKGKTNLPMTSFTFYINDNPMYADPVKGTPKGALQLFNNLNGKFGDGKPYFDRSLYKNNITKYLLSGDPGDDVAGRPSKGWYEGAGWIGGPAPGDRRMLMGSGPFTLAPGDTQEVTIALMIAKGASKLNSVTELKLASILTQDFFNKAEIRTDVEKPVTTAKKYSLEQNYPNPFNPSTTIKYSIAESRNVELKVFDILGNEVATLVNGYKNAGSYSVEFNASKLSSGIYFYTIKAGNFIQTKKLVFLK